MGTHIWATLYTYAVGHTYTHIHKEAPISTHIYPHTYTHPHTHTPTHAHSHIPTHTSHLKTSRYSMSFTLKLLH